MKISIIGAGSWGTTLANLIAENNPDKSVILWCREKEIFDSVKKDRENRLFLSGIKLSSHLDVTVSIKGAVSDSDIILTAIPSQFLRSTLKELKPFVKKNPVILNVAKGLEAGTFKRMSEIIREEIPDASIVVLSGPNHAEEVSRKIPTATVIASEDADLSSIKKILETSYFKVYPHDDVIGLEICGAVKNITAISTGVSSALGLGDNAAGSLITLGLREMVKLGKHVGARQNTFYGLAGVGDLVATCMSKHSRNRHAGELIAKGYDFEMIKKEMHGMVAEGIMTCKAVHEYAIKNDIDLPLTSQVYKVLFEKKNLNEAIADLKDLI